MSTMQVTDPSLVPQPSRRTWAVIVGVIVALLVVRGLIGNGFGKVYVTERNVVMQKVSVPPAAGEPTDADPKLQWAQVDAGSTPTEGAPVVRWTRVETVPPKVFYAAEQAKPSQTAVRLSWPRTVGLWVAAFFTLAIFSFLYADNPAYKFAEAVVVGVSAGYWMVVGFWDTIVPKLGGALAPGLVKLWVQPSIEPVGAADQVAMWLAMVLGAMLLTRLGSKGAWLSGWTLAFIIGVTAGLKLVSHIESDLLAQTAATVRSVVAEPPGVDQLEGAERFFAILWPSLANALIVIGVLCCLTYFFFSVDHKGVVGRVARTGIWYLMITFGAAFGFTVMGRIALLAARIEFLFNDWLWLIDPAGNRVVDVAAAAAGLLGAVR
jgi:hypothetical protein